MRHFKIKAAIAFLCGSFILKHKHFLYAFVFTQIRNVNVFCVIPGCLELKESDGKGYGWLAIVEVL